MVLNTRQLFLSKRVVTEDSVTDGGVLVDENGLIEQILTKEEADTIIAEGDGKIKVTDGGDFALLAGVVDSHVHVNEPGRTAWEGFRTATSAAAAGGITTIVDMPLNSIPPTTTLENLKIKAESAKDNIFVDVGFWGGVIVGNQDSLHDLVKAGVVGFKCFLCPSGVDEFPNVGPEDLEKAFAALEGTGSVLAFHAEMEGDSKPITRKKKKKDPEDYSTYLESRPTMMELNAVTLIKDFVEKTNVRVHIVHVSSAEVVPLFEAAREARRAAGHEAWRAGVTAETCHHYLTLSAEQIPKGRSEYKCAPPIRDNDNKEKLWDYLLADKLDLVVSDHSPCTPELKCSNNLEAWGGISSVQFAFFNIPFTITAEHGPPFYKPGSLRDIAISTTHGRRVGDHSLSLFWTGASSRGLDLTSISKYLSSGPAHLCGLQDRKGALNPGLDADLVYFDPDASFTVTADIIRHKNKLTPYLQKELKGVVKKTYLRGQLIYEDGEIVGEPLGTRLLNNV